MDPSSRTPYLSANAGQHEMSDDQAREGFRPVALPALAAAVHVGAAAARDARAKIAARRSAPIVHEDEPTS